MLSITHTSIPLEEKENKYLSGTEIKLQNDNVLWYHRRRQIFIVINNLKEDMLSESSDFTYIHKYK